MVVNRIGPGSGKQGSDAAIYRLGGCRSRVGELLFLNAKEAIGELPSETLLQSGSELLSGFFKLGAEGLENY
jgi:hypothetical protein